MSAHRTTRRELLAGVATLPATAALATGVAPLQLSSQDLTPISRLRLQSCEIVGVDPIFAAIEAHRRAKQAWEKAVTEADLHDGEGRPTARVVVGSQKEGEYLTTHAEDGGVTVRFIPNGKEHPIYVHDPDDIERNAPKDLKGAARDAWIVGQTAELEKEQARLDEEYGQTEHGKLDAIREEADDLERERLWDLIWTMPTTLGGIAALKAHVRKSGGRSELVPEEDWAAALDWTIEKAVCAIKGLPEPPMDKAVADLWNEGEEVAS